MTYGNLRVNTLTYDNNGVDVGVSVSALAGAGSVAPVNNPTFTGTPTAPTAAVDTNTTQLATTAFVVGQGYLKSATAASTYLTQTSAGLTYAPLASPTFTGIVSDGAGSVRAIPQNAKTSAYTLVASDVGKHISITTGGVTIPPGVFSVGDAITIYNNSGTSQTITQGGSVTLRQVGTANTGNRTLAQYGLVTVLCVAANVFVISGGGLS
jgi:hypothetical protein